jgi:hypothetical protein
VHQPRCVEVEQLNGGRTQRVAHLAGIAGVRQRRQMTGQCPHLGGGPAEVDVVDVGRRSVRAHEVAA